MRGLTKPKKLTLALGLCLVVCQLKAAEDLAYPWLDDLKTGEQVKESGARLVNLPYGLHLLEEPDETNSQILIGVHGWRSDGYEWVYPLLTLDTKTTQTYFFRWDDSKCPVESGRLLLSALQTRLESQPNVQSVVIVGHSLGGVLVASIADQFGFEVKTELHIVAAPLQGLESEACPDQTLPQTTHANRDVYQWRTQFALDNAFNRLPTDPQNVDLPNSIVVRLPDTYNGRRLGHNWSISWVADKLSKP